MASVGELNADLAAVTAKLTVADQPKTLVVEGMDQAFAFHSGTVAERRAIMATLIKRIVLLLVGRVGSVKAGSSYPRRCARAVRLLAKVWGWELSPPVR